MLLNDITESTFYAYVLVYGYCLTNLSNFKIYYSVTFQISRVISVSPIVTMHGSSFSKPCTIIHML